MVILLLALACAPPAETPTDAALSPVQILTRISLDLRGVRPSDDEIQAVSDSPDAVWSLTDDYLKDPRWSAQVRNLYAVIYRTRYEDLYIKADEYGLVDWDEKIEFETGLPDEPLRILSTVAEEDLPWTEIVTGDWTVLNDTLASIWPSDYPEGATGWHVVHYTDGRPAVGVLATNALWIRYYSTESNANRGRANQISRMLLCSDYLERPVDFDLSASASTGDALLDALKSNQTCVSCHSALDPLASYLYGFWNFGFPSAADNRSYHPERELLWQSTTGIAPSYFGDPSYTLEDLGTAIADDPRFASCAAEQIFQGLLGREAQMGDTAALLEHRDDFVGSGMRMRQLYRSVVHDPRYTADGTEPDLQVEQKLATGELLGSEAAGLTGFTWQHEGYDMFESDRTGGVRVLAGGTDGDTVNTPAELPNVTYALTQERLAELAAAYAIQEESAQDPADRTLFTEVDFSETPSVGSATIDAQIIALRRRVLSQIVTADSDEVAEDRDLWETLYADTGSTTSAWQGLLVVLMRDPAFGLY